MTELIKDVSNALVLFKQSDINTSKTYENIRALDQPLSFLIDILINLILNKKIEFFKDFVNCEIIYILTQVFISLGLNNLLF